MKVVVTGGAGFIGSHLVDRLIADGHDVVVIDHHKRDKLRFPNPAATIYKMRFGDDAIREVFQKEKPDAVFHLAAQISVTYSVENPIDDAKTNVIDALHLLEVAKETGVKKIVFVSSGGAIYGESDIIPTPEIMGASPISPYGIHKQAFEHYLDVARYNAGMSVSVLRPANIYGPRQQLHGGEGGAIPIFLNKIFTGENAILFGDGSSTRDYVFVRDAVDVFVKSLEVDFDHPVNICTGVETSIADLWDVLSKIHNKETHKMHEPFRPGEIQRSCLDTKTAGDVLAWNAQTPLERGLRETYDWFKKTYYDV